MQTLPTHDYFQPELTLRTFMYARETSSNLFFLALSLWPSGDKAHDIEQQQLQ